MGALLHIHREHCHISTHLHNLYSLQIPEQNDHVRVESFLQASEQPRMKLTGRFQKKEKNVLQKTQVKGA